MSEAIRLTFVQDDGKVHLRSARRIKMRVPPGTKDPQAKVPDDAVGQWIELKGAKGETLYRRFVSELVRSDLDATRPARGEPAGRPAAILRQHVFTVLVPYHEDGREVLVIERRRKAGKRDAKAAALGFETVRHAEIDLSRIEMKKEAE